MQLTGDAALYTPTALRRRSSSVDAAADQPGPSTARNENLAFVSVRWVLGSFDAFKGCITIIEHCA